MDKFDFCCFIAILFCLINPNNCMSIESDSSYYRIITHLLRNDDTNLVASTVPVVNSSQPLIVRMSAAVTQLIDLDERTQVNADFNNTF